MPASSFNATRHMAHFSVCRKYGIWMENVFMMSLLSTYIQSNYGNPSEDKPSQCEADEVKWFTVERGEVTLLLKERPPLKIYTWMWMTDDREQFEMVHMVLHTTVMMMLQPHRAKCYCSICKVTGVNHLLKYTKTGEKNGSLKQNGCSTWLISRKNIRKTWSQSEFWGWAA